MLNKKEHKNCDSPELIESAYEPQKFQKISNTDFEQMMKNPSLHHDNTVASTLVSIAIFISLFTATLFAAEFKGNATSDKH